MSRRWLPHAAFATAWATALGAALVALPGRSDQAAGPVHYSEGATLFQANCAVCHGHDGAGTPSLAPPLTRYPALYAVDAEGRRQLAMTVLYGMFGDITVEQKHYNFKMPDFGRLDDEALAAVLNYVIFDLSQAPGTVQPMSAGELAAARAQPATGEIRADRLALLGALGL